MARFKLLAGTFDVGTGEDRKTHRFDDPKTNVIESDKDLDKLFKNKFERLGDATAEPRDHDNTLNESGRQGDDPEHLKKAASKVAARKPRAAAEEESPKARKVKPTDPGYDADHQASILEEAGDDDEDDAPRPRRGKPAAADEDDAEVQGDDVTDEFEGAAEAGYTVHKDAKAKVFRLAKGGKQVGDDLRNKTEAKKALKAELDQAEPEEAEEEDE